MYTCEHIFAPSDNPPYLKCQTCSSLYRPDSNNPDMYLDDYWSHRREHSTLQEQIYNIDSYQETGVTKNDLVLKWVKSGERCLEIGCAPGITLARLKPHFRERYGVEPDPTYNYEITKISDWAYIHTGFFPQDVKFPDNHFDAVIGLDIFEHIEDGPAFLKEIMRVLRPNGQVMLMVPLNESPGKMFHPEHIWLYSKEWFENTFSSLFQTVNFETWLPGHTLIIGETKQNA